MSQQQPIVIKVDWFFNPKTGEPFASADFLPDGEDVVDPHNPTQRISPIDFIDKLNQDSALREAMGWHKKTQHPSESTPLTLWERIVAHTNGPDGHPDLKALGLK